MASKRTQRELFANAARNAPLAESVRRQEARGREVAREKEERASRMREWLQEDRRASQAHKLRCEEEQLADDERLAAEWRRNGEASG